MTREELEKKFAELKGVRRQQETQLGILETSKEVEEEVIAVHTEAIALSEACQTRAVNAQQFVEKIISTILQAVVGPQYRFWYKESRNADEELTGLTPMVSEGQRSRKLSSWSGGENALVNIGARIAYLLLAKMTPVLLLDEMNASLSPSRWEKLLEVLEKLSQDHGLQVITVVHTSAHFPHVIRFDRPGAVSLISEQE